ncbi:hypothetical protein [Actinokineospora pegani]|uniref:hypothetical protein n=1 Tax=Actinokineospora pegani TaxID=2654637 RepID=UPI0012E9C753|nr:hypothetical protein [Actinokineospora pegani]
MTSAFQRIDASLGGIGAGAAVAAASGAVAASAARSPQGQFAFNPDEIDALRRQWLDLSLNYRESATRSNRIDVQGPGNEDASLDHARAGIESWRMHIESLNQKFVYCLGQAQKLHDALNDYNGTERSAVTSLVGTSHEGGI